MLNLIKYEFVKKYKLILITLISSVVLDLYLFTKGMEGSSIFLVLFPTVMSILYMVDVIKMYGDDINKKSGYMLFMTPNSGYKIIVSKLITAVIEGFAILLIFFIFILINGSYINYLSGANINFNDIVYMVNRLMTGSLGINLGHMLIFSLTGLLMLISFFTTVYTAMTIRKSIFSEMRFGSVLSFLIFLLINWGISTLSSGILNSLSNTYNSFIFSAMPTASEMFHMLLPINALFIAQSVILTLCSGYLLEKKINL